MKDDGSAAVEYLSLFGLSLFVAGICFEIYVTFSAVEKIENAARTGARVASMDDVSAGQAAAERAMPEWLNDQRITVTQKDADSVACEIWAEVPLFFKGVPFDVAIQRRVQMPVG
ncbi:TadE/TadG family type IV pilus assembly protein [Actinomadura alba]|uniref:TadE-like protein n=1 Tax=Actinomadura alba TaxID=406431 RepID=A0ABR7LQE3_9ACTN|nr:hypothetical protein [Actinomadura alba]MBC6467072.1 hypothetical protein [Actinomadura alba]